MSVPWLCPIFSFHALIRIMRHSIFSAFFPRELKSLSKTFEVYSIGPSNPTSGQSMLTSLSDLACFQSLGKITYQQVSGFYQLKAKDTIRQLLRLDHEGTNTPEVSTKTFGKNFDLGLLIFYDYEKFTGHLPHFDLKSTDPCFWATILHT